MSAVVLQEYQADWPAAFEQLSAELSEICGTEHEFVFEHIGSTSVPGLCAKPVIDILVGSPALALFAVPIEALRLAGFRYRPEYESLIPDRRYFVKEPGVYPRVHVHGVVFGSLLWRQHIVFRNILRQDCSLAMAYGELKRNLAEQHAQDKSAYTLGKAPFIQQVLREHSQAGMSL